MQPKFTSAGEQFFRGTDPFNTPDRFRVGLGILQISSRPRSDIKITNSKGRYHAMVYVKYLTLPHIKTGRFDF